MGWNEEEYVEPQLGDTSRYEVRAKPDHKIAVKVNGYNPKFQGAFSKEPGPAVFVHVADFSEKDSETGKVPTVYPNVAWQGGSLVDGLKALLDKRGEGVTTIVVTGKKRGKAGWEYGTLSPASDETKTKIRGWVEKNGDPFEGIEIAGTVELEAKSKEIASGGLDDFDDTPAGGSASGADDSDAF